MQKHKPPIKQILELVITADLTFFSEILTQFSENVRIQWEFHRDLSNLFSFCGVWRHKEGSNYYIKGNKHYK